MKARTMLLVGLAASCGGEPRGKQIEALVRQDLAWATAGPGVVEDGALTPPPDAPGFWFAADPFEIRLRPEARQIGIKSRSAESGGGGLLVRHEGGPFRLRLNVRIDRLSFPVHMRVGLFRVGADARKDPAMHLGWACHGGEGDRRYSVSFIIRGPGSDEQSGTFEVGPDYQVDLRCIAGTATSRVWVKGRSAVVQAGRATASLDRGIYLLGIGPRVDDTGGVAEATVTIVGVEGDLHPLVRGSDLLPGPVRGGVVDTGFVGDPVVGIAKILGDPVRDWAAGKKEAWRLALEIGSLGVAAPDPFAWIEEATLRYATPAERLARVVQPIFAEAHRSVLQVAPDTETRRQIAEWRGPMQDAQIAPAQRAVAHLLVHALAGPQGALSSLEAALRVCRSPVIAGAMIRAVDQANPHSQLLEEYLMDSDEAPWLAVAYGRMLVPTNPEAALRLAERALRSGLCDERLRQLLAELDAADLLDQWEDARADAPTILRAVLVRQRWMGFGDAAARTARTLLDLDASADAVRCAVPGLLLGADESYLRDLLGDGVRGQVAREALRADPILVDLRQDLIRRLDS